MGDISPQLRRRIAAELRAIERDPIPNVSAAFKREQNPFEWSGTILGPVGTPYDGGVFHLDIVLPPTYPAHPPQITFETHIYHPNIDEEGSIAITILMNMWCPALTVANTLLTICSFLGDPFPDIEEPQAEECISARNRRIVI